MYRVKSGLIDFSLDNLRSIMTGVRRDQSSGWTKTVAEQVFPHDSALYAEADARSDSSTGEGDSDSESDSDVASVFTDSDNDWEPSHAQSFATRPVMQTRLRSTREPSPAASCDSLATEQPSPTRGTFGVLKLTSVRHLPTL